MPMLIFVWKFIPTSYAVGPNNNNNNNDDKNNKNCKNCYLQYFLIVINIQILSHILFHIFSHGLVQVKSDFYVCMYISGARTLMSSLYILNHCHAFDIPLYVCSNDAFSLIYYRLFFAPLCQRMIYHSQESIIISTWSLTIGKWKY